MEYRKAEEIIGVCRVILLMKWVYRGTVGLIDSIPTQQQFLSDDCDKYNLKDFTKPFQDSIFKTSFTMTSQQT